MNPIIYKNLDLNRINLNESLILGIKWINENGIDIEMDIDWCGQEDLQNDIDFLKISTKLVFRFACDIEFSFKHNETWTIGPLEITEFCFKKEGEMYIAEFIFDFQPKGLIKLKCNDIEFIIEEKST